MEYEKRSKEVFAGAPQAAVAPADYDDDTAGGDVPGFEEYQAQFADEGIYAEVTSSGLAGMRGGDGGGGGEEGGGYGLAPPPPPRRAMSFAAPEEVLELLEPPPAQSSGGIDFELQIPGTHSVASGRQRHRFMAGSSSYPVRLEHLLRPAIKDHAFGRVTVTNGEDVPLLAGPASIFVADAFFGKTRLETTPAKGKLVLDLGAETAIKCARRSNSTVRTAGVFTKEDIHVIDVTIEVENYLREAADLELQDQVPISADPKVKVKLLRTDPKDATLDELTGIITFRVKVAPGGRQVLNLVYELEAPKDYRFTQMLGT